MVAESIAVATKSVFYDKTGPFLLAAGLRGMTTYLLDHGCYEERDISKTRAILVLGAIVPTITFNPEFIAGFWDGLPMK